MTPSEIDAVDRYKAKKDSQIGFVITIFVATM